jgi:hypothetical protein
LKLQNFFVDCLNLSARFARFAHIHLTQTRLMICATQELQDSLIGRIVAHVSP